MSRRSKRNSVGTKASQRITLTPVEMPNLVDLQLQSYEWFLSNALRELFDNFSPIEDFTGTLSLEFLDYSLGEPKYDPIECRDRDMTYEMPLKVKVRLVNKETGELKESEVYMGEVPCMTERGTFIVNGAERVVVSQLARSSGVYFNENIDFTGRSLYTAQIIPREGAWIDLETDAADMVTVKVGQARRFPITTLLRAFSALPESQPDGEKDEPVKPTVAKLAGRIVAETIVEPETGEILGEPGQVIDREKAKDLAKIEQLNSVVVRKQRIQCSTTGQVVEFFGEREVFEKPKKEQLLGKWTLEDYASPEERKVHVRAYTKIDEDISEFLTQLHLDQIEVIALHRYVERSLEHDRAKDADSALVEVHKYLRPGDPPTQESARTLLYSYFFDNKRYDLGRVGRFKMNSKLGLSVPPEVHTITLDDLVGIIHYILFLDSGEGEIDDIDHLQNKRVRAVGELLQDHLRSGFLRMERVARERMTSLERDSITAQAVISIKPITAAMRSFFGSGQLSQFMDQNNPLAELTHKRRLSALGPGGLSRQSAKLEVRDVHHSHYGRICPIETPEGPNIGLIGSLATLARVNEFGFIESPYRKVIEGRVTNETIYLTAQDETNVHIAPANTPISDSGGFMEPQVQVRLGKAHPIVPVKDVEYMDVSPLQLFSVATSMIPFLENDDANRALMGSNMQRQAVPLVRPSAPLVKTGIEDRVAIDSGAIIVAEAAGIVREADAKRIVVESYDGEQFSYVLQTFVRSNQASCIHQRARVTKGQRVRPGDVLADGTATENGELALGQNLLAAFMLWEGFNYEDAIIVSERVARDDLLSSIHIERYECEARETKLGPEEITRDIPNVGEEMLKNLDDNGIVRLGAEVKAEDILVGKVAPKSQGELTAEERLVIAIFGKKAEEMRDASLRVSHGESGVVVDVRIFSRYKYNCKRCDVTFDLLKNHERMECERCGGPLDRQPGDELRPGTNHLVRVYVAQRRKVMEGDKLAGRHGNKGVISRILPDEDMPFLPDGRQVDLLLNPLGVPSRMNIGQVLEMHLGLVGEELGLSCVNPIFQGSREDEILQGLKTIADRWRKQSLVRYVKSELGLLLDRPLDTMTIEQVEDELLEAVRQVPEEFLSELSEAVAVELTGWDEAKTPEERASHVAERIKEIAYKRVGYDPESGKSQLRDGRTGEFFNQAVAIGQMYMLKLAHLVEDKIHARSTGPYSLVTQQPLGGKAQFGGQRFGEMEVWALEAYGAAHTLQEILTIKSDDVLGRVKTYESIVKGECVLEPGIPESFKILVKELQSLALQVTVESDGQTMELRDVEDEGAEPGASMGRDRR
ncbi:MAG: DNA-directed RNA polymerase subunit beta [Armatimonadetes bacterium]|nr:DNA-directed RNA polymerase subunit beta [Armatimonadota bacterium]